MKVYNAEILIDKKFRLAESPFYDSRTKTVIFTDIIDKKVYFYKDNKLTHFSLDEMVGSMVLTTNVNEYILCAEKALYLLKNGSLSVLCNLSSTYTFNQRSNDAKVDPANRLFFGSVNIDTNIGKNICNLYSYDGNLKIMQNDTKLSNGLAWNKEKNKFYFADSDLGKVFEYDYNLSTGIITNRKVLCEITEGVPDGLTIDTNNNLWIAIWGEGKVECRSSVDGSILAIVNVDAKNVSCPTFYNDNYDELFITTSGEWVDGINDGCIFKAKVDAKGFKPDLYKL